MSSVALGRVTPGLSQRGLDLLVAEVAQLARGTYGRCYIGEIGELGRRQQAEGEPAVDIVGLLYRKGSGGVAQQLKSPSTRHAVRPLRFGLPIPVYDSLHLY